MEKFSRTLRGYDPEEVNRFFDKVIAQVEAIVEEGKQKDQKIAQLKKFEIENANLKERLAQYEKLEATLNHALVMAQKTSEQIKLSAHNESEALLEDAKRNANRIVNEALLKAEKAEQEANTIKRNVNIFKRRVKDIVEAQLEVVNELDEVEF